MTLRIARSLRAHAFLLVALLGVALLLLGVFEYWRFYRDLYVEETNALRELETLAGKNGGISYQRAGAPGGEWTWGLDEAPPIPLATPLAGRVRAIDVEIPGSVPAADRDRAFDRALRLPGLNGFYERFPDEVPTTEPLDLSKVFGRPVPEFEEPIDEEELDEPFPRGEPLDTDTAKSLFEEARASWERNDFWQIETDDGFDRPFLAIWYAGAQRVAELRDGERVWEYSAHEAHGFDKPPVQYVESIEFAENGVVHRLIRFGDDWRIVERGPQDERAKQAHFGYRQRQIGFDGLPNAMRSSQLHAVLEAATVERIDDGRYRIEFAPCSVVAHERKFRFPSIEAVVRSDMDFALERWRIEYGDEGGTGSTTIDEIRRLQRGGGAAFWTERLTRSLGDYDEAEPSLERERFAVEFDPQNYAAAFDLGTYGARRWPDPEPLPQLRSYRVFFAGGIVAAVLGAVGGLATRWRSRPRGGAGTRLPSLRFGLASLGSATLLLISAAGWYKSNLDVLEEESFLLNAGGWVATDRHEPKFPFSLLTTEAYPIGAPLKSVSINQRDIAIRDRILKLSPLERFQSYAGHSRLHPATLSSLKLGTTLPEPSIQIEDSDFDREPPPGETLSADEAREVAARMFAAWEKSGSPLAEPCCVASTFRSFDNFMTPYHRERAAIRDGKRAWMVYAEDDGSPGSSSGPAVRCCDGAWQFLYERREPDPSFPSDRGEWTLAARRRANDLWEEYQDQGLRSSVVPERYAWIGSDGLAERLIAKLSRDPQTLTALDVERLGDGRYRIELEPPRYLLGVRESGSFVGSLDWWPCSVSRWSIVANETLGWAVERSEIETVADSGPPSKPNTRYISLTLFRYERKADRTLLVECRTRRRYTTPGEEFDPGAFYASAWAYDFSPTIDERIFRLPHLDYPHPPPDPVPRPVFAWWMATAAIACGGFVFAGVARIREARSGRREGRGNRDGKEAQEGTAGDVLSSEAAESTASEVAT